MKLKTLDSSILGINIVLFSIIVIALVLLGCGTDVRVKGGTTHVVEGEATMNQVVTLKIDVSACQGLEDADQAQCIKDTVAAMGDLVDLIKALSTQVPK